jgi:hypothetical protein
MQVLVNNTNILVTANNTKIPATGNTKYQLHGTIQNTSYKEQYKISITRNNTNISYREQYKATTCWEKYKIHQLHETVQVIQAAENNIK